MGTQSTWGHRLRVFCRTDPSPERIHPWIWRARYRFPPRNPEYCRNGGPCVHRLPQGRRNNVKESVNCGRTVKRKLSRLHHVATYLILRKKSTLYSIFHTTHKQSKRVGDGLWSFLKGVRLWSGGDWDRPLYRQRNNIICN